MTTMVILANPLRIAPKEAGEVNGEAGRDDEAEHHKAIQVKAFPV
jgi:hypothetical protein